MDLEVIIRDESLSFEEKEISIDKYLRTEDYLSNLPSDQQTSMSLDTISTLIDYYGELLLPFATGIDAEITGFFGSMFSKKTTSQTSMIDDNDVVFKDTLVFQSYLDSGRFGSTDIVTHSGASLDNLIPIRHSWEILRNVYKYAEHHGYLPDAVSTIEAPFFDPLLPKVYQILAKELGVASSWDGLLETSEGEPFFYIQANPDRKENIYSLLKVTDRKVQKEAFCMEEARRGNEVRNALKTQWKYWTFGPKEGILSVGGKDKYEARSVKHWKPQPYTDISFEMIEPIETEAGLTQKKGIGTILGYVHEVSRFPDSVMTLYDGDDGFIYGRYASLRDMKLDEENFQKLISREDAVFVPEENDCTLCSNEYTYALPDGSYITGPHEHIVQKIDTLLQQNDLDKYDRKVMERYRNISFD